MMFSTIVLLVIATVVLIAVLIWFLPTFSAQTKGIGEIRESAGATNQEIIETKCELLCEEAQDMANPKNSDYCADSDCVNQDNKERHLIRCSGVDCSAL